MAIDLKLVSQLRDKTGAGFGDCKLALEEAGNDLDKAVEIMRKKGDLKAAKKADRAVKEGAVSISGDNQKCAVVALACETDFVSRGDDFKSVVKELSDKLLSNPEEFVAWADTRIKELILKIGENIQLAGQDVFEGPAVGQYLHTNKKVAGICVLDQVNQETANEIAMQIVAMSPKWLASEDVDTEVLAKEREIYREQLKTEGKPEQIWDKIIAGKLAKFYEENCLLNQIFIKDDSKKIKDLLAGAKIIAWTKFSV